MTLFCLSTLPKRAAPGIVVFAPSIASIPARRSSKLRSAAIEMRLLLRGRRNVQAEDPGMDTIAASFERPRQAGGP